MLTTEPWNLPILSTKLSQLREHAFYQKPNVNGNKQIPRNFWMSFKNLPTGKLPEHLQKMFDRNKEANWTITLADDAFNYQFMRDYFSGTSVQWAFSLINPKIAVAQSDIWRYCVLYVFGGLYMDDDSYIEAEWDQVGCQCC